MDHKVSKDMISSGMIPSGEKNQADLGRTQYGSAPSPSRLMDAYKSMYEHHKKDADGNTIPHEEDIQEIVGEIGGSVAGQKAGAAIGSAIMPGVGTVAGGLIGGMVGGAAGSKIDKTVGGALKKKPKPMAKTTVAAGADLFDIVKGRLLDEGLTEEESLDVMLTLTLEEINEVIKLDEVSSELLMKAAKGAEVARGKAASAGDKAGAIKKMKQGEKFYKGAVEKRKASGQMGAGYKESK